MSNIFHQIEHAAKDAAHAVESVATKKTVDAVVDVLTSPAAVEIEVAVVEAAL